MLKITNHYRLGHFHRTLISPYRHVAIITPQWLSVAESVYNAYESSRSADDMALVTPRFSHESSYAIITAADNRLRQ